MDSELGFRVSRAPLNKRAVSSRWTQFILTAPRFVALSFPQPQVAAVKATRGVYVLSFVETFLGLGALGVAALLYRNRLPGAPIHVALIFGVIGLVFVAAGVLTALAGARRQWIFARRAGILRMTPPPKGLGSEIRLSDIAAVQVLVADTGTIAYETNLVLSRPRGKRLTVMCHIREPRMRSDAEKLAAFLQVPLLDHTREPVEVAGRLVQLEKTLVRRGVGSSSSRVLRSRRFGQMVLKPSLGPRILKAFLLLLGLLFIGIGTALGIAATRKSGWVAGLVGFLFCSLMGVGFIVFARWAASPPIVFDRLQRAVRGKSLKLNGRVQGGIPFKQISALQLCSGTVSTGEAHHLLTAFELNLVLVEPPGERVWLVTRNNKKTLQRDAERLAGFLGVPLLDHTDEQNP